MDRQLPAAGPLSNCLQWPGPEQAKGSSQNTIQVFHGSAGITHGAEIGTLALQYGMWMS